MLKPYFVLIAQIGKPKQLHLGNAHTCITFVCITVCKNNVCGSSAQQIRGMGVSSWVIRRGRCLIFIQIRPLYPWKVQQHTIKFAFIFPLMWQTGLSNSLVCAWQPSKPRHGADSALSCGRGQSCNRSWSVCSWSYWSLVIWNSVELQSSFVCDTGTTRYTFFSGLHDRTSSNGDLAEK